jgi:3'(2'), 5'-bisphosphate nucleotidase
VTVADLAVQAFLTARLKEHYRELPLLGEENREKLAQREILERSSHYLGLLGERFSSADLERLLAKNTIGEKSYWILDPIDGTKGYLRDAQYAVALALKGEQGLELGMVGAPNLREIGSWTSQRGFIFFAEKGRGAFLFNPENGERRKLRVSDTGSLNRARVVASLEKEHASQSTEQQVLEKAGVPGDVRRLDSLVKYCLIAAGEAEIYLRIPHNRQYRAKVWDHASGDIILAEAGGVISDLYGRKLNFENGAYLEGNFGILASNGKLHPLLLEILTACHPDFES